MIFQRQINQRDLRIRSKEIMDAVEQGQAFTVTRDGREIAELVPSRIRRRFVPAEEFLATSKAAPAIDLVRFQADLDSVIEPHLSDPNGR